MCATFGRTLATNVGCEGPVSGIASSGPRLHLCALDGTPASLDAVLRAMQDLRPKQLMLETCGQRRTLAERQAAASGVTATAPAATVSHSDAIDTVHGGINGRDIVALIREADKLGAQVYTVDRPYQETQNRVARRLVLHPQELLAFARHSAAVLGGRVGGQTQCSNTVDPLPAGVQAILGKEREQYMAMEVGRRAVRNMDVLLVCSAERKGGVQQFVKDLTALPASQVPLAQGRASRAWPFFLVFLYLIVPGYGSMFIAWRASRWLAGAIRSQTSGGFPELEQSMARPEVVSLIDSMESSSRRDKG